MYIRRTISCIRRYCAPFVMSMFMMSMFMMSILPAPINMADTKFQALWRRLATRWGLSIEAPFRVEVGGTTPDVPVLLKDFGALRGMLLVTNFDLIAGHADELVDQGFGYSCLSEPGGDQDATYPSELRVRRDPRGTHGVRVLSYCDFKAARFAFCQKRGVRSTIRSRGWDFTR